VSSAVYSAKNKNNRHTKMDSISGSDLKNDLITPKNLYRQFMQNRQRKVRGDRKDQKEGDDAQHKVHRTRIPEEGEEVVDKNRDHNDFNEWAYELENIHLNNLLSRMRL